MEIISTLMTPKKNEEQSDERAQRIANAERQALDEFRKTLPPIKAPQTLSELKGSDY